MLKQLSATVIFTLFKKSVVISFKESIVLYRYLLETPLSQKFMLAKYFKLGLCTFAVFFNDSRFSLSLLHNQKNQITRCLQCLLIFVGVCLNIKVHAMKNQIRFFIGGRSKPIFKYAPFAKNFVLLKVSVLKLF